MGSCSLPSRKQLRRTPQCVAQPFGAGRVERMPTQLPSILSQPAKLLDSLARKIGSSPKELKSFIPMTALFFTMAFINTIVNNLSMSLVITAPMGSAGVISFLTVYAALPLTIGATVLYTYASHFISPKRLFTITIGIFAMCNLLFALCLFPNHEALHLPGVADALAKFLPSGLHGAVGMVRNWTFSAFYCLSEMWGDLGLSLLFWGFANDITTSKQAPLLYPLMGIGANVAQILGGMVLKAYSNGGAAAISSQYQSLLLNLVGCMMVVMALHQFIANRADDQKQKKACPKATPSHSEDNKRFKKTDKEKKMEHPIYPSAPATIKSTLSASQRRPIAARNVQTPQLGSIRQSPIQWLSSNRTSYEISRSGNLLQARTLAKIPLISVPPSSTSQHKVPKPVTRNPKLSMPQSKATKPVMKLEKSSSRQPILPKQTKKEKPSFFDSIKSLGKSDIVKSLGIMTIAQALSVTVMEFIWKSHCKVAYPTAAAFSAFMGDVATYVGVLTCGMMVLSPILFRRIGWKGVASITPVLMTVGGCAFFGICTAFHILSHCGLTQLAQQLLPMTVIGGAFLFILSRGTKFSLFKPSEEIIFINMKAEQRQKAKATVDVLGANLGKSGGSLLQQGLLVGLGGHLMFITPVMFAVYMVMMRGWNKAVNTLSDFQDTATTNKSEKSSELKSRPVKDMEEEIDTIPDEASELKTYPITLSEEELHPKEKKEVRSVPLGDAFEDLEAIEDGDQTFVSLSQSTVPWDDDRESVGSSIVEYTSHKDLDDYPIADQVIA